MAQAASAPSGSPNQREELFEQLYDEHYRGLVSFFGKRGVDRETCRDLAQETLIKAWDKLESFEGRSKARTWVLTIAVNLWKNWIRDQKTAKRDHRESSLEVGTDGEHLAVSEDQGLWPGLGNDPERDAVERQDREQIRSLLANLPQRQRDCLELRLEDRSYEEIAAELGISIQTVRSSISRGRARLQQMLQSKEDAGEAL